MTKAYNYIKGKGVNLEKNYKYFSIPWFCLKKKDKPRYFISGYQALDPINVDQLIIEIEKHPMTIGFEV